ncbi:M56 family metallopeptidase [Flavonifractor porci]|uniref:M56 family metallopeptidase n=1 Tax=Flavonifractor porci TaxID=3133422 RepID=UPI00309B9EF6
MTQLLQMSVQGTLVITVLLLLRTLFRRRISPVILYALWLLPAARLLAAPWWSSWWSLSSRPHPGRRCWISLRQQENKGKTSG